MTPKGRFGKLSRHQRAILFDLALDYKQGADPKELPWTLQQECRPKVMSKQILHESVRRLISRGFVEKKTAARRAMLRLTPLGYQAYQWLMAMERIRQLEED